jgi:hypothetical protein
LKFQDQSDNSRPVFGRLQLFSRPKARSGRTKSAAITAPIPPQAEPAIIPGLQPGRLERFPQIQTAGQYLLRTAPLPLLQLRHPDPGLDLETADNCRAVLSLAGRPQNMAASERVPQYLENRTPLTKAVSGGTARCRSLGRTVIPDRDPGLEWPAAGFKSRKDDNNCLLVKDREFGSNLN